MSRATELGLKHPHDIPQTLYDPKVSHWRQGHTFNPLILCVDDVRWQIGKLSHQACEQATVVKLTGFQKLWDTIAHVRHGSQKDQRPFCRSTDLQHPRILQKTQINTVLSENELGMWTRTWGFHNSRKPPESIQSGVWASLRTQTIGELDRWQISHAQSPGFKHLLSRKCRQDDR